MRAVLFAATATCALFASASCWGKDVPLRIPFKDWAQGQAGRYCARACRSYLNSGWNGAKVECEPNGGSYADCVCVCKD